VMPTNEAGEVQRNENEHRTSEGADVGQGRDELNVHSIPDECPIRTRFRHNSP